jgi:ATP-dependent protease ClpP protease subunit
MRKFLILVIAAMIASIISVIAASSVAEDCDAKEIDWSSHNVISVVGEVGPQLVLKSKEMLSQTDPIIRIFINSPGGSVVFGNQFIQAMEVVKYRGFKVECAVTNLAASMAMHILAHCDEKYVLDGGYLLFHEIRTGVRSPASPSELIEAIERMKILSESLDIYLRKELGATDYLYNFHNVAQTLWEVKVFNKMFPKFRTIVVKDVRLPASMDKYLFNPAGDDILKIKPPFEVFTEITYERYKNKP